VHRIKILLPLLRAKVVVLIGAWDEVITKVPYGASGAFGENDPYIARTTFKHLQDTKDGMPFTVVIHSKTIAMSVIHMKRFMLLLIFRMRWVCTVTSTMMN